MRWLGSIVPAVFVMGLVCAGGCGSRAPQGWEAYGETRSSMDAPVALGALKGGERDVVITGTITDVCRIKGCWMNVKDASGTEMFVQFENYGFFVPMNSTGHAVKAHGRAVKQDWSVEELRHFAEDAKKSPEEVAAIDQPQNRVTFLADAVWIEGPGLENPQGE